MRTESLLIITLVSSLALAADPTSKEAGRHFDKGLSLYSASNYEGALAEFEAAHALTSRFEVLFNIGVTNKKLFRYEAAVDALNRYLNEGAAKVPADRRTAVQRELDDIKQVTAEVRITSQPEGALVTVDGLSLGVTPFTKPRLLGPGRRVITVELAGFTSQKKELSLVSGESIDLTFTLEKVATTADITFDSTPSSIVTLDDQPRGDTPLTLTLDPGGHSLTFSKAGYFSIKQELIVVAGQSRKLSVTLEAIPVVQPWYAKWWVWTIVGVVVAGGITGGIIAAQPHPDVVLSFP